VYSEWNKTRGFGVIADFTFMTKDKQLGTATLTLTYNITSFQPYFYFILLSHVLGLPPCGGNPRTYDSGSAIDS
jgi:hypothetical protein